MSFGPKLGEVGINIILLITLGFGYIVSLKLPPIKIFLVCFFMFLQVFFAEADPLYPVNSPKNAQEGPIKEIRKEADMNVLSEGDVGNLSDQTYLAYLYVLGELYGQRGDFISGAKLILKVAEATGDTRLARRSLQFSLKAQELKLSISSINLIFDSIDNDRLVVSFVFAALGGEENLKLVLPIMVEVLRRIPEQLVGAVFVQLTDYVSKNSNRHQALSIIRDDLSGLDQFSEKHFFLAKVAEWASDFSLAAISLDKALALKPDMARAVVLKANIISKDDRKAALDILEEFVKIYPDKDFARLALARVLFLDTQLEKSREQFYELIKHNSQNSYYAYSIGIISSEMDDWQVADRYLKLALKLGYPRKEIIQLRLGVVNEKLGEFNEAGQWYMSVDQGENFILARAYYAGILIKQDKFQEAKDLLGSTIPKDDSQAIQLAQAKAYLHQQMGEYHEAFKILRLALDISPDHQELLYEIAIASEKIDRIDLVERYLVHLIELKPDHAQAYNALGYTLAERTQRYQEAFDYIQRAMKLEPNDPYILDSMGWVCFKMGDIPCGEKFLRAAYQVRPDPEIAAHLGELFWHEGRKEEAEEIWRESLKENPDSDPLKLIIEKYLD